MPSSKSRGRPWSWRFGSSGGRSQPSSLSSVSKGSIFSRKPTKPVLIPKPKPTKPSALKRVLASVLKRGGPGPRKAQHAFGGDGAADKPPRRWRAISDPGKKNGVPLKKTGPTRPRKGTPESTASPPAAEPETPVQQATPQSTASPPAAELGTPAQKATPPATGSRTPAQKASPMPAGAAQSPTPSIQPNTRPVNGSGSLGGGGPGSGTDSVPSAKSSGMIRRWMDNIPPFRNRTPGSNSGSRFSLGGGGPGSGTDSVPSAKSSGIVWRWMDNIPPFRRRSSGRNSGSSGSRFSLGGGGPGSGTDSVPSAKSSGIVRRWMGDFEPFVPMTGRRRPSQAGSSSGSTDRASTLFPNDSSSVRSYPRNAFRANQSRPRVVSLTGTGRGGAPSSVSSVVGSTPLSTLKARKVADRKMEEAWKRTRNMRPYPELGTPANRVVLKEAKPTLGARIDDDRTVAWARKMVAESKKDPQKPKPVAWDPKLGWTNTWDNIRRGPDGKLYDVTKYKFPKNERPDGHLTDEYKDFERWDALIKMPKNKRRIRQFGVAVVGLTVVGIGVGLGAYNGVNNADNNNNN